MSLTLNMVGGGGGGKLKNTDAVLVVTVPTGSTVTATKGGTTLTPTIWVKAANNTLDCAIFSIPASQFDSTTPWTVTATLGTETASDTVLITTNKEYEVELSYGFYVYNNGQTSFTFGSSKSSSVGAASITEGADNITFAYHYANTTGTGYGYFYTNETFDITPYTTMRVYGTISTRGTVGVGTTTTTMDAYVNGTSSEQEYVVDVSQLSGQHMFRLDINSGSSTEYSAIIYSIVLEK